MILKNCKVTIEPKDTPALDVRFWDAEVSIDDGALYTPATDKDGNMLLTIQLKVIPDKTRQFNMEYGMIGDLKAAESE